MTEQAARSLVAAARQNLSQGNVQAAAALYQRALSQEPHCLTALIGLSTLLGQTGQLAKAEELARKALEIDAERAEAHQVLGNILQTTGRWPEAITAFKRATSFDPNLADAHANLASLWRGQGDLEQAEAACRQSLALKPAAEVHNLLANILFDRGAVSDALEAVENAIALKPQERRYYHNRASFAARIIPRWHFAMLNDEARNQAYQAAIEHRVTPESRVLEIGTGSGLLAMMAARAGAAAVTTCEMVPAIARKAMKIVAANGYADRIEVLARKSTDLRVGHDLPRPANLLISEILSEDLLGEGVLLSIAHAKRHLLEPGAPMIPQAASIVGALAGGDLLRASCRVERVGGFDLALFNDFAALKVNLPPGGGAPTLLSKSKTLFDFEFSAPLPNQRRRELTFTVTQDELCVGLIQWIRVQLDETIVYENPPTSEGQPSHWNLVLHRFERPLAVKAGQRLQVAARHTTADLAIDFLALG